MSRVDRAPLGIGTPNRLITSDSDAAAPVLTGTEHRLLPIHSAWDCVTPIPTVILHLAAFQMLWCSVCATADRVTLHKVA